MLPSTGIGRRRKRRRPGGFYSADVIGGESLHPQERDVRARLELPGATTAAVPFSTATIITPTSGKICACMPSLCDDIVSRCRSSNPGAPIGPSWHAPHTFSHAPEYPRGYPHQTAWVPHHAPKPADWVHPQTKDHHASQHVSGSHHAL